MDKREEQYAEEKKICGYCAEGEYLAVFGRGKGEMKRIVMQIMRSVIIVIAVGTMAAMNSFAGTKPDINWGRAPNGEFWNGYSSRFIYAPAFDFKGVVGATNYEYEVMDDRHNVHRFSAATPDASLAEIWEKLPVGYVTVVCRANGAECGRRRFWKKSQFKEGAYPPPAKSFGLAYMRVMDAYFDMPQTKYLVRNGKLDPDYYLSGYPSKMLAAQISALVGYAERLKGKQNSGKVTTYLDTAKKAADDLIAGSIAAGKPLEFFTRTYAAGGEYNRFVGEEDRIMLIYPARAGKAFLELYSAIPEKKYLDAALRIAGTYAKLQGEDGTWPLLLNAETGKEYASNRLQPYPVIEFLEALYEVTGEEKWRTMADRAFKFVEAGPMRDWNWEGQFEDISPTKKRWQNLTKHAACATAQYLLKRYPGDNERLAQAEALVKFSEDQFVEWTIPYGDRAEPNGDDDGSWKYFCRPYTKWMTPCALEQYNCYYPIDASAARFINTYIALWRATNNIEYLAKARALGATATRMQETDGFINTWWIRGVERNDDRYHTWVNCMLATAKALANLAEITAEVKATP